VAKTAWPNETEVTDALEGLGVRTLPTGLVVDDVIDMAVAVLEDMSGQIPFIEDAAPVTITVNPPFSDWMRLGSTWTDVDSVTMDGTLLTLDEDYYLEPEEGPFKAIRFAVAWGGDPQTVVIVGKRGVGTNIPIIAWQGVLDYACGYIFGRAAIAGLAPSGSVIEAQEDSVKIKFSGGGAASKSTSDALMDGARLAFASFVRFSVGNYV